MSKPFYYDLRQGPGYLLPPVNEDDRPGRNSETYPFSWWGCKDEGEQADQDCKHVLNKSCDSTGKSPGPCHQGDRLDKIDAYKTTQCSAGYASVANYWDDVRCWSPFFFSLYKGTGVDDVDHNNNNIINPNAATAPVDNTPNWANPPSSCFGDDCKDVPLIDTTNDSDTKIVSNYPVDMFSKALSQGIDLTELGQTLHDTFIKGPGGSIPSYQVDNYKSLSSLYQNFCDVKSPGAPTGSKANILTDFCFSACTDTNMIAADPSLRTFCDDTYKTVCNDLGDDAITASAGKCQCIVSIETTKQNIDAGRIKTETDQEDKDADSGGDLGLRLAFCAGLCTGASYFPWEDRDLIYPHETDDDKKSGTPTVSLCSGNICAIVANCLGKNNTFCGVKIEHSFLNGMGCKSTASSTTNSTIVDPTGSKTDKRYKVVTDKDGNQIVVDENGNVVNNVNQESGSSFFNNNKNYIIIGSIVGFVIFIGLILLLFWHTK